MQQQTEKHHTMHHDHNIFDRLHRYRNLLLQVIKKQGNTMSEDGPKRTRPFVLITGTPGTGKTSTASLIAVRINMDNAKYDERGNLLINSIQFNSIHKYCIRLRADSISFLSFFFTFLSSCSITAFNFFFFSLRNVPV
jgi:Cdc6-like AAA superfamily ATPase